MLYNFAIINAIAAYVAYNNSYSEAVDTKGEEKAFLQDPLDPFGGHTGPTQGLSSHRGDPGPRKRAEWRPPHMTVPRPFGRSRH